MVRIRKREEASTEEKKGRKRVTVLKKVLKAIKLYKAFGYKEPYKFLFDAQFLIDVVENKVELEAGLKLMIRKAKYSLYTTQEVLSYLRSFGDQYIEAVVLAKKFQKPKRQQIENDVKQLVGKQFKREELWNVKQKANNSILESLGELSKNNNNRARYIVATDDVRLRRKIIKCYADTPTLTVVKDKIAIDYPTKEFHEAIKKHEQATMAKLSELSPWEREEMARILGTPTESAPSAAAEESDSNDEDEQDDIIDDEVDDDDDDDVSEPVTKRARK